MSVSVNWSNPYADRRGRWYKGNLHTHTSPASDCAKVGVERVLDLYVQAGYEFLAISDHKALTVAARKGLVLISGVEWHSPAGEHTGIYSLDQDALKAAVAIPDHESLLGYLADKDALVILNHPNWQATPHYRREQLDRKTPFDGIEVYNGVIERLEGSSVATDKWDYLLAKDRRVLGFASDDSHVEGDVGLAAIVVRSPARNPRSILGALRRGNFYCSTGVGVIDIRREGDLIAFRTEDGQEIQAIGQGGVLVERVRSASMSFDISRTAGRYVRFAAYGPGSSMAWTQPFFRE